jgi:UPF0755 protein
MEKTVPIRKPHTCMAFLTLVIIIVLCFGGISSAWIMFGLPDQTEKIFGPPAPDLGTAQRIYLSARLILQANDLTLPHNVYGAKQSFSIRLGEPTITIADRLQSEGLITNASAFRNFLVYSGMDTTLQAGNYELSPGMTALEIAQALQDATPADVMFHILPGWRIEEIAAALPTSGLNITPEAFQQAASNPPEDVDVSSELPPGASLEGFLYPDAYTLPRETTLNELINQILQDFNTHVDSDLRQGFANQGLSLYQGVTLASIVEREAVVDEEMPIIASVFLNRLAAGLKLDSDPTVQYALGYNQDQKTWWTNPISLNDLQFDSRYNTYLYPGLPPGPIANPGLDALKAVAFPANTPYYYFRATCDGSGRHVFAETFEEHVANECR